MRFRTFRLLMWKKYRWRRHYWIWTLIEVSVPIFIAIYIPYIIAIKTSVWGKPYVTVHPVSYSPAVNKTILLQGTAQIKTLAYTPSNSFNDQLMENVVKFVEQMRTADLGEDTNATIVNIETKKLMNVTELESFLFENCTDNLCMGISFEKTQNTFHYKLKLYDFSKTLESYTLQEEVAPSTYDMYLERGFAGMQLLLNDEFIRLEMKETSGIEWNPPTPEIQSFPVPEYETTNIPRDGFITIACLSVLITSVALSVPFINAVIQEKENGTKELMKIYGVDEWMIWLCWLIHAFTVPAISLTVMTIIFKSPILGDGIQLVRHVTLPALWLLLMLYCIANISFICLFCAIFHRGIVASFAFIIVLLANFIWIAFYDELNLQSTAVFIGLIPASAFAIAVESVQKHEQLGDAFDVSSFGSISYSVGALVFDIFLYSSLTLYVTTINPGTFGTPKPPFFLFKMKKNTETSKKEQEVKTAYVQFIEPPVSQHEPFIQTKGLSKRYGSSFALDGVDLAIYENEISVFLGHSGSGKTVLLSILAGVGSYDEGLLHYKGSDVNNNVNPLKNNLGICFQEDRLFTYLSVMDHLLFFAMLKGLSKHDAKQEANECMYMMEMRVKGNVKTNALSSTLKRKLSIAICMLRKPKILILDEPTFGMESVAKKRFWSVLQNLRQNHVIIMSTSYVKEAERLGDRITIMQNGMLKTHGTPSYLEKTFGTGYELIISIQRDGKLSGILEFMKNIMPSALIKYQKNDVVVYKLPPEKNSEFSKLFKVLEDNKTKFGIINVEVSYVTLEQILLKVKNEAFEEPKILSTSDENINIVHDLTKQIMINPPQVLKNSFNDSLPKVEGIFLIMQQIKVLLWKKMLYTKRNFLNVLIRVGLPSLIIGAVLLTATKIKPKTWINLSLESYQHPNIMLQKTTTNADLYKIYSSFIEQIEGVIISFDSDVIQRLIDMANNEKILFGTSLLAAFEFENETSKILYNQRDQKSLPVAINIYSNVLLKSQMKNGSWKIENVNEPILGINESRCGGKTEETFQLAIMVFFFVFFAFYTVDLMLYFFEFTSMEISKKLIYAQVISNVSFWVYWFTTFLFDFILFSIIVIIRFIIVMFSSDVSIHFFQVSEFHAAFIVMMIMFGISGLLSIYVVSFLFSTTRSMYASFLVLNALCSISMYIFNRIEESVLTSNESSILCVFYFPLKYLILCIPFLNFTLLMEKLIEIWKNNTTCDNCPIFMKPSCEANVKQLSFWNFPSSKNPNGLLLGLSFLFVDIILYSVLLLLIHKGYIDRWSDLLTAYILKDTDNGHYDGDDVKQERLEIQNLKKDKSKYNKVSLVVDGLTKNYFKPFKPITVVENMSFVAQQGTCFGILGINGSGKSTILKMLSTETSPTEGDISIEGVSLSVEKKKYISMIGYFPQINSLFDEFTGKETLKIFGLLNGIKRNDIDMVVNDWISTIELERLKDKICKFYNHSSKRKLGAALSLIGNPKVVFFDEPTSGVDPYAKAILENIIIKSKESGKTVVLGSTSVEECQKLCERITILTSGEMHCIGTVSNLNRRYAVGFSVTIKVLRDDSLIKEFISLEQSMINVFHHKYCFLKEEQKDLLYYHIRNPSLSWSDLFAKMEDIKRNNHIVKDYILKNITLKEIFIAFSQPEHTSSRSTFRDVI